ncbi:MAG: hypothetical protein ACYDAC_05805 [Candidatus Dormibacteria bacterium]
MRASERLSRRGLVLLLTVALAGCELRPAGGAPPTPPPAPVASHFAYGSATYDVDHHELVFLGLVQTGETATDQTWVWRAAGWQQLHPAHSPDPPREALLMDDPATHQVLIQGGSYTPPPATGTPTQCGQAQCSSGTVSPVQTYSDTWVWNGVDWQHLQVSSAPPGVTPASAVYVPASHRLIASFGGPPPAADGLYGWDGTGWSRLGDSGFPAAVVAADPVTGQVVGCTGQKAQCFPDPCAAARSQTVVGDGVSWHALSGTEPEVAAGNVVSDPVDGGVLMLNQLGHTWVLAGAGWREAATAGPDPSVPGFLYTDGSGVYHQPEPGLGVPRSAWNGHAWVSTVTIAAS